MDARKAGGVIRGLGGLLTVIAVGWWFLSFYHYFQDFGVGRAMTCLYSYSKTCSIGSGLVSFAEGTPAYSPTIFWVGVGLLVLGFVVGALGPAKRSS
jgi:hypothetical protein